MWDKLLALFKDKAVTNEIESAVPDVAPMSSEEPPKPEGKSVLLGFNYLKGMNENTDDLRPRKFTNLTKLLRGDWKDGQTQESFNGSESNIRGENSRRRL